MSAREVQDKIFKLFDECIAYVSSKIKKYDAKYDEKEMYYIKEFYKMKGANLSDEYINEVILPRIHGDIRDIVLAEEHRRNKELEEIRREDYEFAVNKARKDLLDKVYKNKVKTSWEQAIKLVSFQPLLDEDRRIIYEEYDNLWNNTHAPATKPKKETFIDKLNNYVVMHADDLLDFNQFVRITSGWSRGRKSINEWYEVYKNKFFKQPGTTIQYNEVPYSGIIGFKGKKKVEAIQRVSKNVKAPEIYETSYFPLKNNIKNYQLHKVAAKGTYLIDLMFTDKLCYLVAINVNTRYLFVELMNTIVEEGQIGKDMKTTVQYLKALQRMIDDGMNVKHLSGDGESAFNSKLANEFYNKYNLNFKPVPRQQMGAYPDFMKKEQSKVKSDPLHGSLGIIDRVIRTIRDMAYNMKVGTITPNIMKIIIHQYNIAPHKGLSKYAKMDVSPEMVQNDDELEEFIVKRIIQSNYNVVNKGGFELNEGMKVKVYNEKDTLGKRRSIIQPGEFVVNGFKNGLYEVKNKVNGKTQLIPRYKLTYG